MPSIARHTLLVLALAATAACGDDPLTPDPCAAAGACAALLTGDITASRTLYADTVYTLDTYVHVTGNGTVLTIEPGTLIKGTFGSALFVLQGARIEANGTASAPIVFTSDQPVGSRKPGDWGGLILVGSAQINRSGTIALEGTGAGEAQNYVVNYSGGNAAGNSGSSGTLRYVRVEFAGFGPAPNQELNSFTFAAIGSGTTLEYLQSLVGLDDSFEWFGGSADARYLVSYEAGDDHFDSSEGHLGRNQYLIGYQTKIFDPRAGGGNKSTDPQGFEIDGCGSSSGCDLGHNSIPLNAPLFANFTMVGTGANADVQAASSGVAMVIRRGTSGMYVNGIVARWPRAAFSLRDPETEARFTAGEALLRNVLIAEIGTTAGANAPMFEASSSSHRFTLDATANNLSAEAGTVTAASLFTALPSGQPANAAALDWSLSANSPGRTGGTGAFTGALAAKAGTFATGTSFRGAADPAGAKWWTGWTHYAEN